MLRPLLLLWTSLPQASPLFAHPVALLKNSHAHGQVAIDNEVMVAISNSNYAMPGGMLDTWMEGVKRANVTNAMVIALDRETKDHAESMGVPAHLMILQVRITPVTMCHRAIRGTMLAVAQAYTQKTFLFCQSNRLMLPGLTTQDGCVATVKALRDVPLLTLRCYVGF